MQLARRLLQPGLAGGRGALHCRSDLLRCCLPHHHHLLHACCRRTRGCHHNAARLLPGISHLLQDCVRLAQLCSCSRGSGHRGDRERQVVRLLGRQRLGTSW